ncbi:MAG: hypothetical protein IJ001_07295 [Oscillospiraceae bacterium]|nr:hypothetical protein [Oscillospiraceae bacterium]
MNRIRRYAWCIPLLLGFLLGNHNGYIALWEDGKAEPRQIFPYTVASLPPADQKALEEGIRLKDAGELLQLLEDYLS